MGFLSVGRAITVRMMFASHGVISIWRLTLATDETRYWYIGLVLCLLLVEMTVTLGKRGGREWKWFCPSVFIYLMSVVPTIWFLELHELDRRLRVLSGDHGNNDTAPIGNDSKEDLHASLGTVLGVPLELKIPIRLTADQWIKTLEQLLLLLLIIGRWILPKGKLTHDQLSQLLLVYIGTAADIVEFFEAFKEEQVRNNWILCVVIMSIWSLSLIQFSLVLTATRVRRDRTGLVPYSPHTPNDTGCCNPDVYGIIISICLQDLPFLVLRMLLIFRYLVVSYTNMFFTCKNSMVIVLLIYRLVVIQMQRRKAQDGREESIYNMLPRQMSSSPSIASTAHDRNRRGHGNHHHHNSSSNHSDTMSLSVSSCGTTRGSRTRLVKPFSSCNNLFDVNVRPKANGTMTRYSDKDLDVSRSHSPV